ncbi:hypothetical protein G647_10217 [Cladophialophora carrionii CBS 160.54]|uniref:Aminoglycoside phosphotransferase domain-containing protein n=1 Tax=Cladophialophora carrionii CBS 160.54 TaxID=1279043 RepID=V9DLF3_9EURO|nr:uncharacterized protein G647_10217 [Cladophialophora carrionii CBS 160.54]ETI26772.1 hypothetical protein G647_10217 [Cladophialophora carrionii CBS 160.54]
MATRPTLPYFAPPDLLPAPLPTVAEILASTQFMKMVATALPHPHVVRVGEHFLVKFGPHVRLQEGENMLFVKQAAGLAVPTVYALFHDEATGQNFIVQEYIQGQGLDEYWQTATPDGKEAVVVQLRQYLDKLRSIPAPGYYGGREALQKGDVPACDTEEQWVETVIRNAEAGYPTKQPALLEFCKRMLHSVYRGHDPVFTHGDLHVSNIRLREDNTVVLIDWECAGWYPSHVEYCNATVGLHFDTDWVLWIPRFLNEYTHELAWMYQVRAWIFWGGNIEL